MRHSSIPIVFVGATALLAALAAAPLGAQSAAPEPGWNEPRALELVRRAQQSRQLHRVDEDMVNYQADARGYVYFLLDHPESGRQSLVRTDQVAVDVYWQAPDQVRQHIVGWRERKELPVSRLYYYLDRLTVVQDNYGDGIMIADGDNVNDVPHPAAAGSERIYDFQLADSTTLRLPGAAEPVRVFELRIRPRDPSQPAAIGSLFVDAASGAVVRMDLTFTRAAYIDRRLDYINVTLENGLWQGRFWLPHEQRLEIRREVPELDFPVGTIIRTRMRVSNYRFNQELPRAVFYAPRITAAAREEREGFAFEQPIDAERRLEGIGRPLDVAELRREARGLVRRQALSGLPRSRLHLPSASDVFRYNRAEGAVLGLGGSHSPVAGVALRAHGGWAFGAERPLGRLELTRTGIGSAVSIGGYLNRPRDVGVGPVASGTMNTLNALIAAADYTDLFRTSGIEAGAQRELGAFWSGDLDLRWERHRSFGQGAATALFNGEEFRPVRPIDEGDFVGGQLALRRAAPAGTDWVWRGEFAAAGGALSAADGAAAFAQPSLSLGAQRNWRARDARLELDGSAGFSVAEIPRQMLFLIGGRGTVSGYPFRGFGGDRYAVGRAALSADLHRPWLRGRLFAETGWAGVGERNRGPLEQWGAVPTDGLVTGVGAGVGIFYDLLHVDVGRGLGAGGRWEISVEAQRAFWDWL